MPASKRLREALAEASIAPHLNIRARREPPSSLDLIQKR